MEHKIYVHIGSSKYDKNLFNEIRNLEHFCKPAGGLWGSPIDSPYGWKEWVDSNNFNATIGFEKYGDKKFYFKLQDGARLLYIDSVDKLQGLPELKDELFTIAKPFMSLDFEALKLDYDAIEVNISSDDQLYWELYGWDVDSILVLNPNCVEQVDLPE